MRLAAGEGVRGSGRTAPAASRRSRPGRRGRGRRRRAPPHRPWAKAGPRRSCGSGTRALVLAHQLRDMARARAELACVEHGPYGSASRAHPWRRPSRTGVRGAGSSGWAYCARLRRWRRRAMRLSVQFRSRTWQEPQENRPDAERRSSKNRRSPNSIASGFPETRLVGSVGRRRPGAVREDRLDLRVGELRLGVHGRRECAQRCGQGRRGLGAASPGYHRRRR